MNWIESFVIATLLVVITVGLVGFLICSVVAGAAGEKAAGIAKRVLVVLGAACVVVLTICVHSLSEDGASTSGSSGGSSHSCCICGASANKVYGGDWWCIDHYYAAKAADGDLSP